MLYSEATALANQNASAVFCPASARKFENELTAPRATTKNKPVFQRPLGPRIVELEEDLFDDSPSDASLCHAVGADFYMGKGIAVKFRKIFGCETYLRSRKWRPGQVARIPLTIDGKVTRYVFHLVTKPFSRNCLPRRHELRAAVRELAYQCGKLKVPVLAMPKIGAGLDRQPWSWVKQVILEEFRHLDIDILVYLKPGEGRDQWRQPKKPARQSPTQSSGADEIPLANDFSHLEEEAEGKNEENEVSATHQQADTDGVYQPKQQRPLSPLQRQIADLEKATRTENELPVEELTPNLYPGRDGASKAVKATDSLEGDQAGRSNEACLLTGAFSLSASSPTPAPAPMSGESAPILCPEAKVIAAEDELNSAPDSLPDGTFSPEAAGNWATDNESSIAEMARSLELKLMDKDSGDNEEFSPSDIERFYRLLGRPPPPTPDASTPQTAESDKICAPLTASPASSAYVSSRRGSQSKNIQDKGAQEVK
jgi:O-acetyl-ADP-ribose deacetylase (regulator of RNase III)